MFGDNIGAMMFANKQREFWITLSAVVCFCFLPLVVNFSVQVDGVMIFHGAI